MPADRCPRCGAAVKVGAQWCSLCYADLRPPPPPRLPAPPVAAQPPRNVTVAVPELLDTGLPLAAVLGAEQHVAASDAAAQQRPEPFWPCRSCGTRNPMTADVCAECGAGFLAGASETPTFARMPGAERLRSADRTVRYGIAFAAMLVFTGLLFLVLFGLGSLIG